MPLCRFTLPNHDQVVATCREYGIRRLEVFGSSLRTPESARDPVLALSSTIRAVELHRASFDATHAKVIAVLIESGMSAAKAAASNPVP